MSTCKECVHFEVCFDDCNAIFENGNAENCTYFKDHSKIIELPFPVGATVWISPDCGEHFHTGVLEVIGNIHDNPERLETQNESR